MITDFNILSIQLRRCLDLIELFEAIKTRQNKSPGITAYVAQRSVNFLMLPLLLAVANSQTTPVPEGGSCGGMLGMLRKCDLGLACIIPDPDPLIADQAGICIRTATTSLVVSRPTSTPVSPSTSPSVSPTSNHAAWIQPSWVLLLALL